MSCPDSHTEAPDASASSHTEILPTATQLYNGDRKLPQELPTELNDVPDRLKGVSNYDTWSFLIETTLESADIPQIIQTSIAHPSPSDPFYALWRRTSIYVKNWLVRQLESQVLARVIRSDIITQPSSSFSGPAPPIFADTMYTIIRRVALDQTPGLQAIRCEISYLDCVLLDRKQFETPREFIAAFRDAVHRTNTLHCTVTAYCAALLMLRGVRKELGPLVDMKIGELDRENAPREYSFREFDSLCDFLMIKDMIEGGGRGD